MLMTGASLFIAGTTALDLAMTLKQRRETREQVKEQEETLKQRERDQAKQHRQMRRRHSINHSLPKELVMDMFESRSGHHKMGNSKFRRT